MAFEKSGYLSTFSRDSCVVLSDLSGLKAIKSKVIYGVLESFFAFFFF